jgi:predicted CoA-substrate-specific enzyme activase
MADVFTMGIDLGSTASKCVILKNGKEVVGSAIIPAGTGTTGPVRAYEECLADAGLKREDLSMIVSTGYGRNSFEQADLVISELSAHATGVHAMYPDARTLIDIGGQDAKVMSISEKGRLDNFIMNDKCAAGTGKFFEAMARTLRTTVEDLGNMSLEAKEPTPISSTCSVFAESEVITAINKGIDHRDIAGGIHESIARRLTAMVNRVGLAQEVVLTGGCAKNKGLRKSLEDMLGVKMVDLPCDPQINGALGAALYAADAQGPYEDLRFIMARPGDPDHPLCEGCQA